MNTRGQARDGAPPLNDLRKSKIIIFGAGKIGRLLQRALNRNGVAVQCFWDNNADRVEPVASLPIYKPAPEEIRKNKDAVVFITIFASSLREMVAEELKNAGISKVISEKKIIHALLYRECQRQRSEGTFRFSYDDCAICPLARDREDPCVIYAEQLRSLTPQGTEPGADSCFIPSMGLLITNYCTLRCRGCNHLRDLYSASDLLQVPAADIIQDMRKITAAVDCIEKVVVVGGEAFLHPDLEAVLIYLLEEPKIGMLQVITNGTVLPKDDKLFRLLQTPRVQVEVSGYGAKVPARFQKNVGLFLDKLKEYAIRHLYVQTLQWFDFGGFEHRGYTPQEVREIFSACCFVSHDLFNGSLHPCSRSVFGTLLAKAPNYRDDYLDVRHAAGAKELRAELKRFLANRAPKICQHCNGTSTAVIAAGAQASKILRGEAE